jgi:hypothetical protein
MSKKKEIQGRKGGKKKEIDRLKGRKCTEKCKIHGEPCGVVMRYKDPQIQATLDLLQSISGAPRHGKDSPFHYCELCSMALRQNRPLNAFARRPNGTIYLKHAGKNRFVGNETGELVMVDDEDYEEEREEE